MNENEDSELDENVSPAPIYVRVMFTYVRIMFTYIRIMFSYVHDLCLNN